MKPKEDYQQSNPWPVATARSYLKLGLAFRDEGLNKEQIEYLTSYLAKALKNKRIIGLRKIDWLGIEIRPTVQLEHTGLAKIAVTRWREAIRKKREAWGQEIINLPDPPKRVRSDTTSRADRITQHGSPSNVVQGLLSPRFLPL